MRDMLALIGELNDSYFRYGSTNAFPEKIKSIIEKFSLRKTPRTESTPSAKTCIRVFLQK